jgi:protein-S-isoprenylcysteine O-methyltransferase Ste14
VHQFIVVSTFIVLGMALLLRLMALHTGVREFIASPTIDRFHYYLAKALIYGTWVLFLIGAIFPGHGYFSPPAAMSWTGTGFLIAGAIIMIMAFTHLGNSLYVGLPEKSTSLKTLGIYRYSRNPLYLGVFIISIGSCLYFPDLINCAFCIVGIYYHHKIILNEEHYLSERYGIDWDIYRARVSRYF